MPPVVVPTGITIRRGSVARMERSEIRERSLGVIAPPGLRFAPSGLQNKNRKRNADKRCSTTSALARGTRPSGRARLSAFHHGACGSDRTPPLCFRHALPGTRSARAVPMVRKTARVARPDPETISKPRLTAGVTRAFQSPSSEHAPADRSSCRPDVSCRSRPGTAVTSRRPREPHSLRRPCHPTGVL